MNKFCVRADCLSYIHAMMSIKHYTDPELLEINTLENAIYMAMQNDVSFMSGLRLVIFHLSPVGMLGALPHGEHGAVAHVKAGNNNQDFVLNVAKYEFSDIPAYRYCSSEKLEHCKAIGRDGYVVQYKIGDWIYYNYDID